MSRAGAFLETLISAAPSSAGVALSQGAAQSASAACRADADDYWFSGLVSLGNACASARESNFTWATVQAYYASFFLTRATLGFRDNTINFVMYKNRYRHVGIEAKPGAQTFNVKGNTHDAVLRHADKIGAVQQLANQPIDLLPAGEWLINQRNEANYQTIRFRDPQATPGLRSVARLGIRKTLNEYISDHLLLAFDPQHSMLAYPVAIAVELVSAESPNFSTEELDHLRKLFCDQAGPVSSVERLLVEPA